jgi:hypothetical protein
MNNFSPEQLNYITAKANYDSILDQIKKEIETAGIHNMMPKRDKITPEIREQLRKISDIETEIEFRLGKYKALEQLVNAENDLINWLHNQMKTAKKYGSQKEDMDELFKSNHPKVREKLIDSACNLTLKAV